MKRRIMLLSTSCDPSKHTATSGVVIMLRSASLSKKKKKKVHAGDTCVLSCHGNDSTSIRMCALNNPLSVSLCACRKNIFYTHSVVSPLFFPTHTTWITCH